MIYAVIDTPNGPAAIDTRTNVVVHVWDHMNATAARFAANQFCAALNDLIAKHPALPHLATSWIQINEKLTGLDTTAG